MSERRTALITGASSGIGAAVTRRLAARKHDCILAARRKDPMDALAREVEQEHGVRAHVLTADLGARGGAQKLIVDVAALGAPVDVLGNNAGFGVYGKFVDQSTDRVMHIIQLNLVSLPSLPPPYLHAMPGPRPGRLIPVPRT